VSGDEGGSEGAGWVHGGAADGAGEHGFERDDGADDDAGGDSFFFCAGGDAQNCEHEDKGEYEFQNEGLDGRACWESGAKVGCFWKEKAKKAGGGKRSAALSDDIRKNTLAGKTASQEKRGGDGGIEVGAGDFAEGVYHGEDNEAEGKSDSNMGDGAAADFVDNDRSSAGEYEGESSQEFGE